MGLAIQRMFDGIARRYDFLNHFLSAGRDRVWRRRAAACLPAERPLRILDLCGGTGDFWKAWADSQRPGVPGSRGVIADFSLPMLREARRKLAAEGRAGARLVHLVRMDALRPCFKPGSFDAVICAYGMRNLDSTEAGIEAVRSVLRPGGRFVTLEFFRPQTAFTRFFYHVLAPLCIPLLGWFFSSRRDAYAYLVESIRRFRGAGEYGGLLAARGFGGIAIHPCDFGISHIVAADKPEVAAAERLRDREPAMASRAEKGA